VLKTRREVLRQGVSAGALLSLGPRRALSRDPHHDLLDALRGGFGGRLVAPGQDGYEAARNGYWRSPLTNTRPALIARCSDARDVARCVTVAAERAVPLAVRGGGHCFVGWGGCEGGLVIDTAAMRSVRVDAAAGTISLGAGCLTREAVGAAGRYGLAPVLGQCPGVGVAGLTLGGGLGWLSGRHGAACDNLIAADLVTADGRSLRVSAAEHPELLWALRGGGGNFGVVTELTLRLHPVNHVISGRLDYRFEDAEAVMRGFRQVMQEAPDGLQASLTLGSGRAPYVSILLCFDGSGAAADALSRRLRGIARPLNDTLERQPYSRTAALYPASRTAFGALRGCYLPQLADELIDTALAAVNSGPGPGIAIGLDHYMHGAVCRPPEGGSAFELRAPGAAHAWVAAEWQDPARTAALLQWLQTTLAQLQRLSSGRVYINFPADPAGGPAAAAWPENHRRLAALKASYDPGNLFRRNYNVAPAVAASTAARGA
jgi:FAD/FMN-containing dehydrogenase